MVHGTIVMMVMIDVQRVQGRVQPSCRWVGVEDGRSQCNGLPKHCTEQHERSNASGHAQSLRRLAHRWVWKTSQMGNLSTPQMRDDARYFWLSALLTRRDVMSTIWIMRS